MKPDKNKDITDHMAEVLRKHSLPYKEGAWERFKEFEASKKKKTVLWPYLSGIAAAILIAFTLFMKLGGENTNPHQTVALSETPSKQEQEVKVQSPVSVEAPQPDATVAPVIETTEKKLSNRKLLANNNSPSTEKAENDQLVLAAASSDKIASFNENVVEPVSADSRKRDAEVENQPSIAAVQPSTSSISIQSSANTQSSVQSQQPSQAQSYAAKTPVGRSQPFAYNEDHETDNKFASQSSDKWNFSLEVSPNIKDNNVNFGGGLGVAYNISKRLSINSGVSYVQLNAHRGPNQVDIPQEFSKTSLSSYSYTKSLNEINTSLAGLDIPVNLKLNINSNMYASAGVSVFSVLNESRNNSFEEHVPVLAYSADASAQKTPQPVINTVYSTEKSTVTPYEGKNFTGFFNLSVGYKLPFLQLLNLAVEPYVKLPIGSLSNQDMDLSNGGLKVITSF